MIDLRSDTVTRPTAGMLDAMMHAAVGDDVFGEDPAINDLEQYAAGLFNKEAALFCTSGTQANQIAVKAHTQPAEEVIIDRLAHIYYYEGGGIAFNSGCSVCLLEGDRGRITAAQVKEHINPLDDPHRPLTRLVCIENTMNKGGGAIYDFNELVRIEEVCRQHGLKYHLDGARLFNAIVETGKKPADFGRIFDSVSICLSKGLGAPVGSLLIGDTDFIRKARRIRKVLGGGMRQAGFLAAAGKYALLNHIDRLKEDHLKARQIGEMLKKLPFVSHIVPIDTNMIFFHLDDSMPSDTFLKKLRRRDIHALALSPQVVRFVTHLDITGDMMETLEKRLSAF
ncbi:MAG TPA: GntG family PLP-dependent aldolase [Bacteroidales bacterium]|nr:GntG family PLP-dependent aldolase [Bacteroidales bacterium]